MAFTEDEKNFIAKCVKAADNVVLDLVSESLQDSSLPLPDDDDEYAVYESKLLTAVYLGLIGKTVEDTE